MASSGGTLIPALADVEAEIRRRRGEVKKIQDRLRYLEQTRDGLRGLIGDPPKENGTKPAGADDVNLGVVIEEVLLDAGRPLQSADLIELVHERTRGRFTAGSIYETTRALALDKHSDVVRRARNRYAHTLTPDSYAGVDEDEEEPS